MNTPPDSTSTPHPADRPSDAATTAPAARVAPPGPDLSAPDLATAEEAPGQRLGRYKLLQKIGEGGCGVVYMAEQEEPVRRRVALKVIKLGMDTKEVIARFEAERQALALMDHPNIARVFDAGSTATGRPFFVMELVRGIPLTRYCDDTSLTTTQRLALFTQVCHAVQHAHQKGIIHRDLKPSNILVTLHDTVPVPKVIDFGIAKATQGRLTDSTVFTAFEQFVGTPAYMSPEQAQLSGLDVDTRSDIYSLGVLLYELLTGRPPFDPKTLVQAGLDEIRRIIREVDPPKPSTRLTTLEGDALTATARQRQLSAPNLVNLIRGDLDWIVMRCLDKDRTRRYDTASALAADLQHYLLHEPVTARPPSRVYRFQKLVRRNRLAFAAAAAVVASLVFGLAFSTWSYFQEKAARAEAVTQNRKSEQITAFLENMLGGARPSVALGKDTRLLREIMDKTVARLGTDLKNQPDVEATLRTTLGTVYLSLDDNAKAEAMQREALALRRRRLGENHDDVATSLNHLAVVLNVRGDLPGAEAALRDALRIRRAVLKPTHTLVAATLNDLGCVLQARGDLPAAETVLREALLLQRKANSGAAHAPTFVTMLCNLAVVAHARSDEAAAEQFQREALDELRRWFSSSLWSPATGKRAVLEASDKTAEIEAALADAINLRTKLLDGSNLQTAWARQNLAVLLLTYGDLSGSEMLGREALDLVRHIAGPNSWEASASLAFLLGVLIEEKKFAAAEPLARQCLALREKLRPDDWRTCYARTLLGAALLGQNKNAEAGPLLLAGAEGLLAREKKIFPASARKFLELALRRAVQFYEATSDDAQVTVWRGKLDAFNATEAVKKARQPNAGQAPATTKGRP